MNRTFTDDAGTLTAHRRVASVVLFAGANPVIACPAPTNRANVAAWVALATACEAREDLRPYGRRIRHQLGTVAGIDGP